MLLILLLACTPPSPSDTGPISATDTGSATGSDTGTGTEPGCAPGLAFFLAEGQTRLSESWRDETQALLAGTYSAESGLLHICEGELSTHIQVQGVTLTIEGAGQTLSTLAGVGEDGIITVDGGTLAVSDLSLTGGFAERGGAITASASSLSLSRLTLSDNGSLAKGGALWMGGGAAELESVDFVDNHAGDDGGGMAAEEAGPLTLTAVSFSGNSAPDKGGGLFLNLGTQAQASGLSFTDNVAAWGGGLAMLDGAGLVLDDTRIEGNTATDRGGGAHINNSTATLQAVTITDNGAADWAGGLGVENGAQVSGLEVVLSDNRAASSGGGAGCRYETSLVLEDSTVSDNQAGVYGGGLYLSSQAALVLVGSRVSGNSAATRGGGLALSTPSSASLQQVDFLKNEPQDGYLIDHDKACSWGKAFTAEIEDGC